jgi:protocatechuate 3,4-dioxygenase beta subunit
MNHRHPVTRRAFVLAGLSLIGAPAAAQQCRRTPAQPLGPYYREGQPSNPNLCLRDHSVGLTVAGRVFGYPECRPIADSTIEIWHADPYGRYTRIDSAMADELACLLRGTVRSDKEGRYAFRTIMPGIYPGRPRHIHFRVSAVGYRVLATQMYMPGQDGVEPSLAAKALKGTGDALAAVEFNINLAPL